MADFTDAKEAQEYIKEKVSPWLAEHPPVIRKNWRLCEYYFMKNQGTSMESAAECSDVMERSGAEASAAAQALGLDDESVANKRRKTVSPADKHKQHITKLNGSLQRMGRLLSSMDQKLPVLRRQLPGEAFRKVREGVNLCRQCREQSLDAYEDLKLFKADLAIEEQDEVIRQIQEL